MNLKFLETFVWVARLKSFRLTAEKLFSTQASISGQGRYGESITPKIPC